MAAEGVVSYASDREMEFVTDAGERVICHPSEVVLVEPKYEHDAFYMDARGLVYRYTIHNGDHPWNKVSGGRYSFHDRREPVRPLRKMEPVS